MTKRHLTRFGVAVSALAMVAAGCSGTGSGEDDKTISIGAVPGWTDQTGTAHLLKNILEENGYTVEIKELSDNAPVFAGVANGDIDILSSTWPERTHKSYMDKYGDKFEDLGTYYEDAALYLAVPEYSDIKSIDELPSHANELGGKVVGIEPGAGLTKLTKESAFPKYGLDKDFKLVQSSTTAMITELKKATAAKEPIVVTLWKPFWVNQSIPVRALQDPKGAYGDTENLHSMGRPGFKEDFPEVAELIENFKLNDEQYGSLEDTMVNKFGQGQEEKAVAAWLKENPDFAPALAKHLKGAA
jgi:glycine betaine/proline transport system substrate-binding protein